MPSKKKQTAIRLSDEALRLIEILKKKTGLNVTGVIETAIRDSAQLRGVPVNGEESQ